MVQRKGQQRNGITWLKAPRIYCDLDKRETCASVCAMALCCFSAELHPLALIKWSLVGDISCRN